MCGEILVDTREQRPFSFEGKCRRATLRLGDYSVEGHAHEIAVERKSLEDLARSLTSARDRFMNEIRGLAGLRYRAIVVEGTLRDVHARRYTGGLPPQSIFSFALSATAEWDVPLFFCADRAGAVLWTEGLLTRWAARLCRERSIDEVRA